MWNLAAESFLHDFTASCQHLVSYEWQRHLVWFCLIKVRRVRKNHEGVNKDETRFVLFFASCYIH